MHSGRNCLMLVDDDPTIIETLSFNLQRQGYEVVSFNEGIKALSKLDEIDPSLIILDWTLPDIHGPEICQIIRARPSSVPILMLTGRAGPTEVAKGLSSGADDYLAKPFSVIEMLARVQALLRRASQETTDEAHGQIVVGELTMDLDARTLSKSGRLIDLSPREFALLKVLMSSAGKALSTENLLNRVWGADYSGDVKTVAVHVRWLRQKLEIDPKHPVLLETVQRSGYRLNRPAQPEETQGDTGEN